MTMSLAYSPLLNQFRSHPVNTPLIPQFSCTLLVLAAMVCFLVPVVTPSIVLGGAVYALQVVAVDRTNREVKRLANGAMAPILTVFVETNGSRLLARAMALEPFFTAKQAEVVDEFSRCNFFAAATMSFAMMTAQIISFVVSTLTATVILANRDSFSAANAGLALTYRYVSAPPHAVCHFTAFRPSLLASE